MTASDQPDRPDRGGWGCGWTWDHSLRRTEVRGNQETHTCTECKEQIVITYRKGYRDQVTHSR